MSRGLPMPRTGLVMSAWRSWIMQQLWSITSGPIPSAKRRGLFFHPGPEQKDRCALPKAGELDKAMEILFDMVEHYHLTKNPKGMVEVMTVIAELYREKGENQKAADTFCTISSIHKNFKHKRMSEEFAALAEELEQA